MKQSSDHSFPLPLGYSHRFMGGKAGGTQSRGLLQGDGRGQLDSEGGKRAELQLQRGKVRKE